MAAAPIKVIHTNLTIVRGPALGVREVCKDGAEPSPTRTHGVWRLHRPDVSSESRLLAVSRIPRSDVK